MRSFVKEVFLFTLLLLVIFLSYFYAFPDKTDAYVRVSSPKQNALIVGSSRAAQGIIPSIIIENTNYTSLLNFSFTNKTSPYGQVYYNKIKEKIDFEADNENSFFIVSIDPWSISTQNDTPSKLREEDIGLDKIKSVTANHPNINYLLFNYKKPFYRLIYPGEAKNVDKDGWLKVSVPMSEKEILSRERRQIEYYLDNEQTPTLSQYRINFLVKTIELMKQQGDVYLVHLPVGDKLMGLEATFFPRYYELQDSISKVTDSPLLDFSEKNEDFQYTDGQHLFHKSSEEISKEIANFINHSKMAAYE